MTTVQTSAPMMMPASGVVGARFGGLTVSRSLVAPATVARLLAEATRQRPGATRQDCAVDDLADERGGQPSRLLWSAGGGPEQDAMYADPEIARKLTALVGFPVVPSGNRGSYSYYAGDGDFLGLHRDVNTCDITLITVLADESGRADPRGGLLAYPGRCGEPLSAIRATPLDGAQVHKPAPGSSVVIAGGEVAHRVLPTAPGPERVVSVLCFEADPHG